MKKIMLLIAAASAAIMLAACSKIDVVGNASAASFDNILKLCGGKIKDDSENLYWSLLSPDGTSEFIISKNFSKAQEYDVMLRTDAKPFINAGLDTAKLTDGMLKNDKIILGAKLINNQTNNTDNATMLQAYKAIVKQSRASVNYHAELDHFGIDLSGGNAFEWAKNTAGNEKDMVFVLEPSVFASAGVDTAKLEGWELAKVKTMDKRGKPIEVEKLLKSFNLN
ncbi:MAG TPA: hypothetical protein DCP97_04030 [Ruminococcaceae bacterium]|nr:hypothetical protein [Oscillospiraceae bacterium]